jgi:hypothetical protein
MRRMLALLGIGLASVTLVAGATTPAAATPIRDVNDIEITGTMHLVDDERRRDDIDDYPLRRTTFRLVDLISEHQVGFSQCHGGEIRGELHVTVSRITGRPGWVSVTATGELFEKTRCHNNDREDVETITFDVAPNTEKQGEIKLRTRERRSHDRATMTFKVKNHWNPTG